MTQLKTELQSIVDYIDSKQSQFKELSDSVWRFAELGMDEYKSADLLANALAEEGFHVERGVADMETSFVGTFGTDGPIIAFLGEFDALSGLSQEGVKAEFSPIEQGGNGHGCGHNLLGVGSLAAAFAAKHYLEKTGMKGQIRYYGCPAEENGYGKMFMAREGLFNDVDLAFCWHPGWTNTVMNATTNAVMKVHFKFKGRSAHAAMAPHLGRSALDSVEIMNIGTNYLREHMESDARIHYAIINTGGFSPNVVQAEAEVTYFVRAPRPDQVKELFERVVKCAEGASLMSGTSMEYFVLGSCHNTIVNEKLETVLAEQMQQIGAPAVTPEEVDFAKAIFATLSESDKAMAMYMLPPEVAAMITEKPLVDFVSPRSPQTFHTGASTDVADVSWIVPTAQCTTATWAFATPFHTWQATSQSITSYAHKAMLFAGKSMAAAAIDAIHNPNIIEEAKAELKQRLNGQTYESLTSPETKPSLIKQIGKPNAV